MSLNIPNLILSFGFVIILLSFHEYAHATVASWLGDRTAEMAGRKTLNPAAHIDPFGTILLPLMLLLAGMPAFGGAKPVPVDLRSLRNPKRDHALIALAGPMMNILLAFGGVILIRLLLIKPTPLTVNLVSKILIIPVWISLYLAGFNLIPLPPLDGFNILLGILPRRHAYEFAKLERYSMPLLMGLIFIPYLLRIPNPVFIFIRGIAAGLFTIMTKMVGM
ncbi:site-2 protease family protein [Candidatus Poribacteria bacterium]|nr:site-2 protease family protein [Candidatus Poribacteria bacterium]